MIGLVGYSKAFWLRWNQLCFFLTPPKRRVLLHLKTDGRFIPFLLLSLAEKGYALLVVDSPFIYRELLSFSSQLRLPFLFHVNNKHPDVDLVITDDKSFRSSGSPNARKILLDMHFFQDSGVIPRMPYFMHPSVYYGGVSRFQAPPSPQQRRFRIGFFGTHDPEFYSKQYLFSGLNRTEVIQHILHNYGSRVVHVSGPPEYWPDAEIVFSLDDRGGDRQNKSFLSQEDYFAALHLCDFVISPPGVSMPISHSLIEAMFSGAIPINSCPSYLIDSTPIKGFNFQTRDQLTRTIDTVLAMNNQQVLEHRSNLNNYYKTILTPRAFANLISSHDTKKILVNAEEISVPFVYPLFSLNPPELNLT